MKRGEINKLKKIIEVGEQDYDFNDYIFNYIDEEDLKDLPFEDLEDYLVQLNNNLEITETEVIYYSNAIDYLKDYDFSLNESLGLAEDLGYKFSDLNSELLASLLKSHNNLNDYNDFIGEIITKMEE